MSNFTITIVGTGVIGTSIGLALKQQEDSFRLLAHDKDLGTAKAAAKMGAFDKSEWNLINACEPADLVILAIPLSGIRATLEAIGPYLKQGAVVTDTCRNKASVLAWAKELLPDHVHFVGGNPVVRPAGPGHENATADLFQNRLFCLTPSPSANEDAVQLMTNLISLLGAEPFFLDAAEHDGLITAIEYLPSLASMAMLSTLAEQRSWREIRKLAGGLFERVSAGAAGDPDALSEGFMANRETLVHWLDQYLAKLGELRTLLASEEDTGEELAQRLDKAIVARLNWLKDYEKGDFLDPELATPKMETPGLLNQMIGFGRLGRRRSGNKDSEKK